MYDNWKKYNSNSDYQDLVDNMYEASKEDRLVFFIGAGVSINQGYPNWNGYVQKLLNYWKNEVNKFILESDEPNSIIKSSRKIGLIIQSDFGNKRKVDFLYQILKDLKGLEWFNEHRLDFEKKFFINKSGEVDTRSLIYSLTKLNSFFITTNYDNEIERYLKFAHEVDNPYIDVEEIDYDNISTGTVMHIHGTPKGKSDHFINSTETYKNHYYMNNEFMDRIREFIDRKNCMLVFVGSSMEEDEVLSLISNKDNHFAIMKADDNLYENGFCNTISSYNQDINNTKIFWYGNNFKDLPLFIEQLSNDVLDKSDGYTGNDYYKFINKNTSSEEIYEIIDRVSKDHFINFMSRLDNELLILRSKQLTCTSKFINGDLYIPEFVWDYLNQSIDDLHKMEVINIADHIKNSQTSYDQPSCFKLFTRLDIDDENLYQVYDALSDRGDIMWSPFAMDSYICGMTLIKSLNKNNSEVLESSELNDLMYSFDNLMYRRFSEVFEKSDYFEKELDIDSLMRMPKWSFVYNLLKNNKIMICGSPWYEMLDVKIFKSQIFIKILMNIYEKSYMSSFLKLKVIKNAEIRNTHLGNLFNAFLNDNYDYFKSERKLYKKPKYVDTTSLSGVRSYTHNSYINRDDIFKDDIVKKLLLISKEYITFELGNVYNKNSTIDNIVDMFNSDDEEFDNRIKDVLYNEFNSLFISCKMLYAGILKKEKNDILYRKNMNKLILNFYKGLSKINYLREDDIVFSYLFSTDDRDASLQTFFNLPVIGDESIIISSDNCKYFDIFFNTSVGRYFGRVKSVDDDNNFEVSKLIKIVKSIKNKKIREISEGFLYKYHDILKYYLTPYNLLGILFFSRYVPTEMLERSQKSTHDILCMDDFDTSQFIKSEISFLSINLIDPNLLDKDYISTFDYDEIIKMILFDDDTYKFEKEWLIYVIRRYPLFLNMYINRVLNQPINNVYFYKYTSFIEENVSYKYSRYIPHFKIDKFIYLSMNMKKHISKIYYHLIEFNMISKANLELLEYALNYLSKSERKLAIEKLRAVGLIANTYYYKLLHDFIKI